jgi:hypothetical protein
MSRRRHGIGDYDGLSSDNGRAGLSKAHGCMGDTNNWANKGGVHATTKAKYRGTSPDAGITTEHELLRQQ